MTPDTPTTDNQSPGNGAESNSIPDKVPTIKKPPIGHRLTLGKLTALQAVERACYAFRRYCERAVVDAFGRVSLTQASAISTATRWECVARVAGRRLADRGDGMSDDTYLTYMREVAKASAERDKAIDRLGLPQDKAATIYEALYGPVRHDATGAIVGDVGGNP